MSSQIIAVGGGGFSDDSEPELDVYILEQSDAANPGIGFIATASGDAETYLLKFYQRFSKLNCTPSHLTLFRRTPDLQEWVAVQDVIFVGGGNTKSMLAVWKVWGLPDLLKVAAENGTILAGISAGAMCWFEVGITDSVSGTLAPLECLGFVKGSCCPHYSKEAERKPTFEHYVREGNVPAGIAIDDGAAVHLREGTPIRIVSARSGASAYHVARAEDKVVSTPLANVETVAFCKESVEESG